MGEFVVSAGWIVLLILVGGTVIREIVRAINKKNGINRPL
jgi:hypothetical protein